MLQIGLHLSGQHQTRKKGELGVPGLILPSSNKIHPAAVRVGTYTTPKFQFYGEYTPRGEMCAQGSAQLRLRFICFENLQYEAQPCELFRGLHESTIVKRGFCVVLYSIMQV